MPTLSQVLTRRRDASASLVLLIVSIGFSLAVLDVFVVNVALPNIAHDFGSAGLGDLSWVLSAYAIVYAALLVVFGRLADRFPREYGFLLGVAVFTVASALCAAATGTLTLVVFRVVQGAGAALMTPTSLSMVLATSSGEERERNVRAWTAIGGLMAALGPVAGGLLVATLFQVAFGGFLLSLVLWDQSVWHWSALHTGLAIAPSPFLVLPTALLLAERLIKRFGSGVVIAIGASFFATGMLWFALFAGLKPDYLVDFFPGLVLIGVGVGLALPTMMASATSELPPENFATGSAVGNIVPPVGPAAGAAGALPGAR